MYIYVYYIYNIKTLSKAFTEKVYFLLNIYIYKYKEMLKMQEFQGLEKLRVALNLCGLKVFNLCIQNFRVSLI